MVKDLKDIFKKFNTEKKCIEFLIQQRWNGVPTCPHCGSQKSYVIENGKRFKCGNNQCYKKYTVTVGSVMHASNIPLTTWMPAIYLISAHKKGISSVQLAKDLNVTQKTAWFMIHRIRKSLQEKNSPILGGEIELDETYVGGKIRNTQNRHKEGYKRSKDKLSNKQTVLGMVQRGGNVIVNHIPKNSHEHIMPLVEKNIALYSTVITDTANTFKALKDDYFHYTVNHSKGEYARLQYHTNTIEGFFSQLKRAIYGTWHFVSPKHLQTYCNEIAYKYNTRKTPDGERFERVLTQINGKLPYKVLINAKDNKEESNQAQA